MSLSGTGGEFVMSDAHRVTPPAAADDAAGARREGLTATGGVVVAVVAAVFMLAVLAILERYGVPAAVLIRDPASQLGFWPFYGFLSHLGVFLLGACGAILSFVAVVAGRERGLFAAIGALSLLLAADDFLMLHEHFLPNRGIPERAIYAVYALWGLATAALNRRFFLGRQALAFWLAVILLGASAAVDAMQTRWDENLVLEDTLKFCGIAVWAAFWIARAGGAVRATVLTR